MWGRTDNRTIDYQDKKPFVIGLQPKTLPLQALVFVGVQAFANKKMGCGIHRTTMTLLDLTQQAPKLCDTWPHSSWRYNSLSMWSGKTVMSTSNLSCTCSHECHTHQVCGDTNVTWSTELSHHALQHAGAGLQGTPD